MTDHKHAAAGDREAANAPPSRLVICQFCGNERTPDAPCNGCAARDRLMCECGVLGSRHLKLIGFSGTLITRCTHCWPKCREFTPVGGQNS